MTHNPQAALVEALRKIRDSEGYTGGASGHVNKLRRIADSVLENMTTPPPMPKLTPLPVRFDGEGVEVTVLRIVNWLETNRSTLESIIAQQENTVEQHNVNDAPTRGEVEELRGLTYEIQNSLGRLRAEVVALDRNDSACMCSILERLDALEARNHTDKPLPDGLNSTGKPKCGKCGDTKVVRLKEHAPGGGLVSLCPCVKVGAW